MCGNLEKQKLFSRICFAHKTTYAYLSLFVNRWNIQENLDLDLFWTVDGRFCEGFPPFDMLAPRNQTCHFFYCTEEVHFLRRIFWDHYKSGNFGSWKVTRFSWNRPIPLLPPIPLLHPRLDHETHSKDVSSCIMRHTHMTCFIPHASITLLHLHHHTHP